MNKNKKKPDEELPIIQQTYDLIKWYVPVLNKLPRDYKFNLGDRIIKSLYDTLEDLIYARYATEKLGRLEAINTRLDVVRYQTRLLKDFQLIDVDRYGYASKLLNTIGRALGGWIGQQRSLAQ
ncbi:MAG: diversity-generating retroelement protein Avd [Acidobacteriota bacterium]